MRFENSNRSQRIAYRQFKLEASDNTISLNSQRSAAVTAMDEDLKVKPWPLPVELIIGILEYLQYRDLLNCRVVRIADGRSSW